MEPHRVIADAGTTVTVRVFGSTAPELVENATVAMMAIDRDLASIPPTHSRPLVAPGDRIEELLEHWLIEVGTLGDEHGIVWSQATVDRLETGGVQGSVAGVYGSDATGAPPPVVTEVGDVVAVPEGMWVDVVFARRPHLRGV